MILNTLKMGNFRVYRGDHEIDLRPEGPSGAKPIILFGGLNGAGKTSILTAVRLTLYGRRILGAKVPSEEYHRYLSDCIHKPAGSERIPNSAYVRLNFSDSRGGRQHEYDVVRSWFRDTSGAVTENLQITRDDEVLSHLSHDQAQSFLNDLIPLGIADLFFFDGEKIAELAESKGNAALADAIQRLLGLDLVNRLRADLGVYIRNHSKGRLPEAIRREAEALEADYERCYSRYQHELEGKEALEDQLHNLRADIAQLEQKIEAHGGAWYENQAAERERMERQLADQEAIRGRIRSLKGSLYPLALAPTALDGLLAQLDAESNYRKQRVTHQAAKRQAKALRKELESALQGQEALLEGAIEKAFGKSLKPPKRVEMVHDLSDSEIEQLRHQITVEAPKQKQEVDELEKRLEGLRHEISECAANLERAPDEQRIKPLYEKLHEAQLKQGRLNSRIEEQRENAKRELRSAMDCIRKLRKLEAEHQHQSDNVHAIGMAKTVREMLTGYSNRAKASKISELENHFSESFKRLSRKDHEELTPKIDPNTFGVELAYSDGKVLEREQLSAGEKQIYATAMLEALGKASGLRLPVIIDTPLGRLDSKHRSNIVDNYFTNASHQVVLLSTDTEIELEKTPQNFKDSVSKLYALTFNSLNGGTSVQRGYF
ncbi:DNA sulfur modification protein DndD [Halomonas fontilapidosi]|uniref:DNA sulfur modification protein DndD n=1 Tax=Halomonas fontilapidosi TaxID=616675 RepID=A0A7W5DM81_9GAMM|nr:DNA sulfur modification protein DndD [Halomonas fontilapidosi]MBB3185500.1 DNA sulfur modification protein DndD [Halomonas fontilapidosi]